MKKQLEKITAEIDNMESSLNCYITEQYYKDNPHLKKILDIDDSTKYNIRTHLCLNVKFQYNNNVLIPLRKNLGEPDRKFGKIEYPVPSASKPNAGLDYRYIIVIIESKYLRFDTPRISNRQIYILHMESKLRCNHFFVIS